MPRTVTTATYMRTLDISEAQVLIGMTDADEVYQHYPPMCLASNDTVLAGSLVTVPLTSSTSGTASMTMAHLVESDPMGALTSPSFDKHVTEVQKNQAETWKQSRLHREETTVEENRRQGNNNGNNHNNSNNARPKKGKENG